MDDWKIKEPTKRRPEFLNDESSKGNIEDRVTYLLSEWLNDSAPLGQERYREPAKAVIREVEAWLKAKKKK